MGQLVLEMAQVLVLTGYIIYEALITHNGLRNLNWKISLTVLEFLACNLCQSFPSLRQAALPEICPFRAVITSLILIKTLTDYISLSKKPGAPVAILVERNMINS